MTSRRLLDAYAISLFHASSLAVVLLLSGLGGSGCSSVVGSGVAIDVTDGGVDADSGRSKDAHAGADADSATPTHDSAGAPDFDRGPDAASMTNCAATHIVGCVRGMYLSLRSDHVGQIVFGGATEPYKNVLGDPAKEAKVLDFIGAHRIESLALYDLKAILGDPGLSLALLSFLDRAAARGVVDVEAVGDTTLSAWDAIAAFQRQNNRFDGLVTEIEFWATLGPTFQEYMGAIRYVRSLAMKARDGGPMRVSSYVGWPDQTQIEAIVPLIDRLYVHVYVKSADLAYAYGMQRFGFIASANARLGTHVDVRPIFSAEGVTWSAGPEHFMGDWLSTRTLDEAETILLAAWKANPPGVGVSVTGIQYYSDFFLEQYLK